jgi:hypothetical protein
MLEVVQHEQQITLVEASRDPVLLRSDRVCDRGTHELRLAHRRQLGIDDPVREPRAYEAREL